MCTVSSSKQDDVIALLLKGTPYPQIRENTGVSDSTISRIRAKYCSDLPKSTGGCPRKLSPSNIQYATCLITSHKADNAAEVTKILQDV
ncbi:hypothetical protein BJ165DRAFT_1358671, partial [Panaeolus papilionaceus]